MKNTLIITGFSLAVCLMTVATTPALAQDSFESVTGDAFVRAVPADFYLEGNHIPVEKRDAALLKNGKGGRVVVALINTSGYSSQIKQKYIGMLITETKISVCRNPIRVGSYGFGLDRPPAGTNSAAVFKLYDQAGGKVFECTVQKDNNIKPPKPLAVSTPKRGARET